MVHRRLVAQIPNFDLPPGLSLNQVVGEVYGRVCLAGEYEFFVRVSLGDASRLCLVTVRVDENSGVAKCPPGARYVARCITLYLFVRAVTLYRIVLIRSGSSSVYFLAVLNVGFFSSMFYIHFFTFVHIFSLFLFDLQIH